MTISAINQGQLAATKVSAATTLYRENLPLDDNSIEQIDTVSFGGGSTFFGKNAGGPIADLDVSTITSNDYARIQKQAEMLDVKGTVKYDNGLDETQTQPFCYAYLNPTPTGSVTTAPSWHDCDEISNIIAAYQQRAVQ